MNQDTLNRGDQPATHIGSSWSVRLLAAPYSVEPAVFPGSPPTHSTVKMLPSRSSLIFGGNNTSAQRKRFGADSEEDVWRSNHLGLHHG